MLSAKNTSTNKKKGSKVKSAKQSKARLHTIPEEATLASSVRSANSDTSKASKCERNKSKKGKLRSLIGITKHEGSVESDLDDAEVESNITDNNNTATIPETPAMGRTGRSHKKGSCSDQFRHIR